MQLVSPTGADPVEPGRQLDFAGTEGVIGGGSRPGGQRAGQVLALVKQRPGLPAKDVSIELGVDPTSLYPVVKRLEQSSVIKKQGRELQPI